MLLYRIVNINWGDFGWVLLVFKFGHCNWCYLPKPQAQTCPVWLPVALMSYMWCKFNVSTMEFSSSPQPCSLPRGLFLYITIHPVVQVWNLEVILDSHLSLPPLTILGHQSPIRESKPWKISAPYMSVYLQTDMSK